MWRLCLRRRPLAMTVPGTTPEDDDVLYYRLLTRAPLDVDEFEEDEQVQTVSGIIVLILFLF